MSKLGIGRALTDDDGKKIKRCTKRGTRNRRHIVEIVKDGMIYTYHATKGWWENRV